MFVCCCQLGALCSNHVDADETAQTQLVFFDSLDDASAEIQRIFKEDELNVDSNGPSDSDRPVAVLQVDSASFGATKAHIALNWFKDRFNDPARELAALVDIYESVASRLGARKPRASSAQLPQKVGNESGRFRFTQIYAPGKSAG